MKNTLLWIFAFVAVLVMGHPSAAEVERTLSWEAPTQYVNGAPLPAEDILGYKILYSIDSQDFDNEVLVSAGSTEQIVVLDLPPRAEPYTIYAVARTIADTGESPNSNVASFEFEVPLGPPGAPTNLRFVIN